MKAKHIPRIDIHDRIELKNALPLRTPYVIYIDPSDTCNFRCKFCPSGNKSIVLLRKIITPWGACPDKLEEYNEKYQQLTQFTKEN